MDVREQVAHGLEVGVQHGQPRIGVDGGVELATDSEDEAAGVEEAVVGAVGDVVDFLAVEVVELALDDAIEGGELGRGEPGGEVAKLLEEGVTGGVDGGHELLAHHVFGGARHLRTRRQSVAGRTHRPQCAEKPSAHRSASTCSAASASSSPRETARANMAFSTSRRRPVHSWKTGAK
ncbi:hypothetical protein ABH935_003070 [Catenulispora sp. GAS73]|uniref:hypothetical protein n=1 Tax=Catenulispora sp. GAS73 TaxID=3156269 RepID=UPI003513A91D